MKFAIIGATGNVGRKTIDVLEKSKLDIEQLHLVASKNSSGKKIKFKGKELTVVALENYDFEIVLVNDCSKDNSEEVLIYIPVPSNDSAPAPKIPILRVHNSLPISALSPVRISSIPITEEKIPIPAIINGSNAFGSSKT